MKKLTYLFASTSIVLFSGFASAQALISIETVPVGNSGNLADAQTGYGAVAYNFNISKNKITVAQYATFLNAVATCQTPCNPAIESLWDADMADPTEKTGILITRSGSPGGPYSYAVDTSSAWGAQSGDRPIAWVSWFHAARFVNWVNNGANASASTETGAYTLTNYMNEGIVPRNPGATWWIPSEDEWYKAAYYDPNKNGSGPGYWNYATKNDTIPSMSFPPGSSNSANFNLVYKSFNGNYRRAALTPVGAYATSPSAYGTFDQAGLLWEWTEGIYVPVVGPNRIVRGGSYSYGLTPVGKTIRRDYKPGFYRDDDTGFRVAKVYAPG